MNPEKVAPHLPREAGVVAGADGAPLVLFHGDRPGIHCATESLPLPPDDGIYFTSNRDYALGFTEGLFPPDEDKQGWLHSAYLVLKHPFIVEHPELPEVWEKLNYRGFSRAELTAQGFDGIIARLPAQDGTPEEVLAVAFSAQALRPIAIEKSLAPDDRPAAASSPDCEEGDLKSPLPEPLTCAAPSLNRAPRPTIAPE